MARRAIAGGWISEGDAWHDVRRLALAILSDVDRTPPTGIAARSILRHADHALLQLSAGMHRNPGLVIYGNPPQGGELMSRRVLALEYQHADDHEDYRHDCNRGVSMFALGDGAILLQRPDRKPLSREFSV